MGTVITNLKARFGVDTADFKKGLKDGDKALDDFKGAAGDSLDKFASMFGVNMRAVNDSVNTAFKTLNFLGQSFKAAAAGGNILTIALKALKIAMLATGVGALVVALGSLVAYFTKSGEGADKFAKILAQVKSVVNNVIERLAIFGEGLWKIMTGRFKEGWEAMRGAFKGIGEEIKEDWKAAGALAEAEDALEDREIALINSLDERRAKVAELRLQAKEEMEDQKEKLALLSRADTLIKGIYADQISLEQERLRIMKERLALQTKDPTDEQRREIAEQEAKISQLYRQQAEDLKAITREKGAALKIVQDELALEKLEAEQIGITKDILENIQMPDIGVSLSAILAPVPRMVQTIKSIMVDVSSSVNSAWENMAVGLGEFLGSLASGEGSLADFGKMILSTLGDVAISVGKTCIAAGIAMSALKSALNFKNPVAAIAAGIALIAIGTAIKSSLSSAANGVASGGGGYSTAGSPGTYDTRAQVGAQEMTIHLKGEFLQKGPDLVATIDQEYKRKNKGT
jgi:hypothetical protein